ncbi:MAG: exonuclease domain-containing protein [Gammaproteobacteria bacterium]|nr:exonuclease domain-containing protein [Gammaproteobacteria bacterium]
MLYNLIYRWQHWRFSQKANVTPVGPLYQQPVISRSQLFSNTRFLVIDCEMSGLNPKKCQLLSIGWVIIEHGRIVNATAKHLLVHADRGTGESSKIHGLLDSNIAGAKSVATVLMLLMKLIPGSVLVFHHASLDLCFLQKAAVENFRCPLLFSYVDTMMIEKKRLHLQGNVKGLRLAQCRQRYGLPDVMQHNALSDAVATAELLLAQASYLGKPENLRLSDMLLSCAH